MPIKYINRFRDRHGNWRIYFRRGKMKAVPLPGPIGSRLFNEAYADALEQYGPKAGRADRRNRSEGTLGWVIKQYRSPDNALWTSLAPGTQDFYSRIFDWLDEHYGRAIFSTIEERLCSKIRNERKKTGTTVADRTVDKIGMLWNFAKEHLGMDNLGPSPSREVASIHPGFKSHPAWPAELCKKFEAEASPRMLRAYFLLRYSGQRRSDVVKMQTKHFDGSAIEVVQQKTGTYVWIPCHAHLRDHLKATGIFGDYLLTSAYGGPYKATSLTNNIILECKRLGFPRFSGHGLRHLAGASLAEAGCTIHEIMSILGHLTEREAHEYVRQAQRKVMAQSGITKWEKNR
jgi:integrase